MRKRFPFLLLLLSAAACAPIGPTPSEGGPSLAGTPAAPVFVPAMCTLMGSDERSVVPAGHPVILMWGWSAATEEQIREYIRVSEVVVTFDEIEISGRQQGGIPYDEAAKLYKAVWVSNIGIPKQGIHSITYRLTFREKLFDGFDYYGPGTDKEKQEDKCEIDVK